MENWVARKTFFHYVWPFTAAVIWFVHGRSIHGREFPLARVRHWFIKPFGVCQLFGSRVFWQHSCCWSSRRWNRELNDHEIVILTLCHILDVADMICVIYICWSTGQSHVSYFCICRKIQWATGSMLNLFLGYLTSSYGFAWGLLVVSLQILASQFLDCKERWPTSASGGFSTGTHASILCMGLVVRAEGS